MVTTSQGLPLSIEISNRSVDQAMVFAVEVVTVNDIRDFVPSQRIEHQAAEQGLFGLYGVRRYS